MQSAIGSTQGGPRLRRDPFGSGSTFAEPVTGLRCVLVTFFFGFWLHWWRRSKNPRAGKRKPFDVLLTSKNWLLQKKLLQSIIEIHESPNESLIVFTSFGARQMQVFTRKFTLVNSMAFYFRWGPIQPGPQPMRSLTEETRSTPIRRRPSMPGPGSRRVVHARPRGVLIATATTFCTYPAHPVVMESPAHEGMCRRILYHSLIVRLADPICRTDTAVSLRSPVSCLSSRPSPGFMFSDANRFLAVQWTRRSRKCRGCALTNHDARRCPKIKNSVHPCVCQQTIFTLRRALWAPTCPTLPTLPLQRP